MAGENFTKFFSKMRLKKICVSSKFSLENSRFAFVAKSRFRKFWNLNFAIEKIKLYTPKKMCDNKI